LLAGEPDYEQLRHLEQPQLLRWYAPRAVEAFLDSRRYVGV
jgi:hypothetical protein